MSPGNEGTGAEVYGHGVRQRFAFSPGQYITVFQAEVYAIKACAFENIKRSCYWKKSIIYILSDSQAVIKVLHYCKTQSKLSETVTNP
jgi:hypothetical protein